MPSGDRLDNMKVKAISNLLLGAVHGLTVDNISITDTNGTVYNSIIGASDDAIAKIEENDKYMQSKVNAQLDKLIGKGNYIATVSTFLTQAPVEKSSIVYDPNQKTSVSEQEFKETLGDNHSDSTQSGMNPVSMYVPDGVKGSVQSGSSSQDRKYSRTATETQYGVTKTQINEYMSAGIIEKISIAVTMNADAMPPNMTLDDLKEQIARAASPKVSADDVSIAFAETIDPYLASDRPANLPIPEASGNPWWLALIILIVGLIVGFVFVHKKLKVAAEEQEKELKQLREKTKEQEKQIVDVNLKAAELVEKQSILAEELLAQQKQLQIEKKEDINDSVSLEEVVEEVSNDIENADSKKTLEELKSWIEKS